jgi:protein tyrosine phosphatase (PTP) superfamily phosphohydrolase (DUF442 family)|tara:strand:- start:4770 stop:5294 length:525 start_codon:yes stop_codon:yes gene_type:complete
MNHWTRNIPGFFLNILKRIFLTSFKAKEIKRIYNYRKVPNLFETSGQPGKQQLKLLAKKGYEVVINLAPSSIIEGSVINEAEILEKEEVEYIHIPVDFFKPTEIDFKEFVSNLEKNKNKKIWVHCAANIRVSAFVYKYRRDVLKLPHDEIIGDMESLWTPNKTWNSFLDLKIDF